MTAMSCKWTCIGWSLVFLFLCRVISYQIINTC